MAEMKPKSGTRLSVGVFDSVARAASVISRFMDAGLEASAVGLLMSDRAAERHLGPPNARNERGAAGSYGAHFNQLATNLAPMAALGTMGSGLVAAGPLASALIEAGVGSRAGLEQALVELGLDPERASEATRNVKNGSVVVSASVDDLGGAERWSSLLEHESAMAFELLAAHRVPHTSLVSRAEAPVGDQRARYEPVVESPDAARGTRMGASRLGS